MEEFSFDPTAPRTIWMYEANRPAVHEHRTDSTVITHIRPSGGKSSLMAELVEKFIGRGKGRELAGRNGAAYA